MKQNTKIRIIAIVVVGSVAAAYLLFNKRAATVNIPALSLRGGSANASTEFLNAQKAVDYYRDEIQKNPEKVKNYIELAQLFLQESRVTGRHHEYIPKAQYLIEQALERDPQNYDAIVTKATMLLTMHHFADGKELAERAVAQQPHTSTGYGVLCDAQV